MSKKAQIYSFTIAQTNYNHFKYFVKYIAGRLFRLSVAQENFHNTYFFLT